MSIVSRVRGNLRYAPVLLGALALLLPWAYLLWNTTLGELTPHLRMRNRNSVAGVFADVLRKASWQDVLSARAQHDISEEIGRLSPVFGPAVRTTAQVYFSVFGMSPYKLFGSEGLSLLFVVPSGDLYQWPYVREYCTRDVARLLPEIEAGARDLRLLQNLVEARGKAFLYVITPSKPAVRPSRLPASFRCPAPLADRVGKLAAMRQALQRSGVHYLDGAGLVADAQARTDIDLFARGSAHWNELAAAMAARALTEMMPKDRVELTPFSFTWQKSWQPLGMDRELLDAMRLLWPDYHYEVPRLTYTATATAPCHSTRVAEIGGSFMFRFNAVLAAQPCPPTIHLWFYWDHARVSYPGEIWEKLDASVRAGDLRDADLVIAEENESVLPRAGHIGAALAALSAAPSPMGGAALNSAGE